MVAKEFLDYLNKFNFVKGGGIYDIFDRLIYILTFSIILVCSAIVTLKSYILDPISCYVATNIDGANAMSYINNYCWITGTVSRDVHNGIGDDNGYWDIMESKKIYYYQWVPLVLGMQAALIYLPYMVWEGLIYNRLGTNLHFVVDMARKASLDFGENRQSKVGRVTKHIYTLLASRMRKRHCHMLPWKCNLEIFSCYLLLKVVSFVVIVMQFVLMESFLNMHGEDRLFGWTLLRDIMSGHHWSRRNLFPRTGFCRVPFKVNHAPVANVMAQCSLSVNMLNEKIYIFLWWWFSVIASVQIIGITLWIRRCLWSTSRIHFIDTVLLVNNRSTQFSGDLIRDFDRHLLSVDGNFLMHMTRLNCGDLVANEVVQALMDMYQADPRMQLARSRPPSNTDTMICV